MALKKDAVITQNGFEGSLLSRGAYWKIHQLVGGKNGIHIEVHCLVNDAVHKQVNFHFVPELDGDNFIKQAYLYLKTLPEFAGATDC